MATAHVVFTKAMDGQAQTVSAVPSSKQTITTSGLSQATTIVAGNGDVALISATGGNVWAKFEGTPVASAGNDWLIIDGETRDFGKIPAGFKVALIDAV